MVPAVMVGTSALTPVIPPTPATAVAQTGLARMQAIATMVSAANHAIIQRVATGDVEVPDLGRIAVKAAAVGGRVDIDVTSDRSETRAVLHASVGALLSDLRQADIAVRQLRLPTPDAGSMTSDRPSRDTGSHDAPPRRDPLDIDPEEPTEVGPVATVRIVL